MPDLVRFAFAAADEFGQALSVVPASHRGDHLDARPEEARLGRENLGVEDRRSARDHLACPHAKSRGAADVARAVPEGVDPALPREVDGALGVKPLGHDDHATLAEDELGPRDKRGTI